MTELNPSYGGPFIQKTGQISPHDIMKRIIDDHPTFGAPKIDQLFIDAMLNDPDLNIACLRAFAINVRSSIVRLQHNSAPEIVKRKQVQQKEMTRRVARAVVKTKHALLVTVMAATFGELSNLAKSAPKLARIAKMGKPNRRVSDVLSESDVLKVLNS